MNMYFTYTLFTDISFIKWSKKTLQIFLITPNSGHKMCEEPMCNIWSCVFPFCNIQNCQGNLGFLSWNIIEKSLKFFDARLWEPWTSYPIVLKCCSKHDSDIVVFCATFQTDWTTKTDGSGDLELQARVVVCGVSLSKTYIISQEAVHVCSAFYMYVVK